VLRDAAAPGEQRAGARRPGQQRRLREHLGVDRRRGDGGDGDEAGPRRRAGGRVEQVVGVRAVGPAPEARAIA
jgi:hypothetical protein